MEFEIESGSDIEFDSLKNEFTGSLRESTKAPEPHEPICLISYEITHILLGDGPHSRPSFWKHYRRELELNRKTDYNNYHVAVCQHQLLSLGLRPKYPVYFRNNKLTVEKALDSRDPMTTKALLDSRFN